jgi:hypothetical protein
MYTRKPKNITKFFLGGTSSAQTLHTWEYADKSRQSRIGSSAILSDAARKRREANRKTIGEYRTSHTATVATKMRRDISEFTRAEHQKITKRLAKTNPEPTAPLNPPAHSKPRPTPDASLYRRPLI